MNAPGERSQGRMKSKLAAKVVAGVTLAGALLVGMAAPAFADSVTIRKVDTTKFPQVVLSVLATGGSPTPADFHLRENGKIIEQLDVVPLSKTNVPIGIVLAIDVSGSMTQNGKLDQAKAAARQFVAQKLANDQIAIVTFSSEPHLVSDFTTDARKLTAAIDGLVADGETALFDGVRQAVGLFSAHPELQANVVLLTDGKDTVSTAKQDDAVSSALGAHATVFTVGLQGGDFDEGPIHSLANATGGQYQATADPRVLSSLYASVSELPAAKNYMESNAHLGKIAVRID